MIFADTHVLVWLASNSRRLPEPARERLLTEKQLVVSAIIAWEYVELRHRGRLQAAPAFEELAMELSLQLIDFPAETWRLAAELPQIHSDPIDRMLIAHSLIAGGTLATGDANMRRYPVNLLW